MVFFYTKDSLNSLKKRCSLFNQSQSVENVSSSQTEIRCFDPRPVVRVNYITEVMKGERPLNRFSIGLFDGEEHVVMMDQSIEQRLNDDTLPDNFKIFKNAVITLNSLKVETFHRNGQAINVLALYDYTTIGYDGPINEIKPNPETIKINELSFNQTEWSIDVKCLDIDTVKGFVKKNSDGEIGQRQRFLFQDTSGFVEVVAFHQNISIMSNIEKGSLYRISNGLIKFSNDMNKRWPHRKNKKNVEIEITTYSNIELVQEKKEEEKKINDKYTNLSELIDKQVNSLVNVMGIVVDVEDVCEQTFKDSNNKLAIRRIYIADHTNSRIAVSFWGDQAIDFQMDIGSVIVLNGVKLTNYNGLSLSVIKVTYVYDKTYAQNSPRIQILKDYWQEKSDSDIKNYNNLTTDYSNTNYSKKRRLI
jgi:hypothetical protein